MKQVHDPSFVAQRSSTVAPATATGATRRWLAPVACLCCLATLTALILVYALASLPEWLSLLIGVAIVLVFMGLLVTLSLALGAVSAWEPEEWQ